MSMELDHKRNPQLPHCLIETNILPRVSAKTIGRCMCVCKQWKSLLSTPTFARTHLRHVTINDYKLLKPPVNFRTLDGSKTIRHNPNPDLNTIEFIVASLDGLVCLSYRESTTYKLAIWNPLTGAYKNLSPLCCPYFDIWRNIDRHVFGFYMDSSNDYKLLCLFYGGLFGTYIYSHKLDSWRKIKFSLLDNNSLHTWSQPTFWGQCLYFTVIDSNRLTSIICFDAEMETFRKIQFSPSPRYASYCGGNLVVLNGCIHLCVNYKRFKYMWRMDGDDWLRKVAPFKDPLCIRYHHECTRSISNWLEVVEENKYSFETMNPEDFMNNYCYWCTPDGKNRSSQIMYVETLLSPNS